MDRHTRSLEELITLQDKAIQALQQANFALQLALESLQAARSELGYKVSLPFIQTPLPVNPSFPYPPYPKNPSQPATWEWKSPTVIGIGGSQGDGVFYSNGISGSLQTSQSNSLGQIGSTTGVHKSGAPNAELAGLIQAYQVTMKELYEVSKIQ